jgi:hypothetical protein
MRGLCQAQQFGNLLFVAVHNLRPYKDGRGYCRSLRADA